METIKYKRALIVDAGEGLSASLAKLLTREGIRVALAARETDKLVALCKETGATAYACGATSLDDVTRLFASVERDCGAPDVVVYNASATYACGICGFDPCRRCESYRRQRVWWLSGRATGIAPHAP